jgi:aminoglycoside 6-adenylyltransferase
MRSEKEMLELIIKVANDDERIRAVMMVGSRADPDVKKDKYRDYDITYFVKDISPFFNNTEWVEKHFGKPLIMQMPETMELIQSSGDGHFTWLIIFEDGNRIDLSVEFTSYVDDGEPAVILLDKDGFFPKLNRNKKHWHIKPPSKKYFYDCCNEFWWCLNNVAKGIARDELPYAMNMYNRIVRDMLDKMVEWFIGVNNNFSVSSGKMGKYFKNYLSKTSYEKYKKTYSDGNYNNFWDSIFTACELFHLIAVTVAKYLNISYNQNEENGMLKYLNMVKNDYIN